MPLPRGRPTARQLRAEVWHRFVDLGHPLERIAREFAAAGMKTNRNPGARWGPFTRAAVESLLREELRRLGKPRKKQERTQ